MSKGLEALNRIRVGCLTVWDFENATNVIEKELKEKAKFDALLKRYNLEDVEELDAFFNEHLNNDIDKCSKCREIKALEIIKEKRVDIGWLIRSQNYSKYNLGVGSSQALKKNEYDLLKEVLC